MSDVGESTAQVKASRRIASVLAALLLIIPVVATSSSSDKDTCDDAESRAAAGSALGLMQLASCYASGKGRPKDFEKAEELLRRAMDEAPNESWRWTAAHSLSVILLFEQGDASRYKEGIGIARRGVEQGNISSYVTVGIAMLLGRGAAKSRSEAFEFLKVAADAQDLTASMILFGLFLTGAHGFDQELATADIYLANAYRGLQIWGREASCEYVHNLAGDWLFDGLIFSSDEVNQIIAKALCYMECDREPS